MQNVAVNTIGKTANMEKVSECILKPLVRKAALKRFLALSADRRNDLRGSSTVSNLLHCSDCL